MFSKICHKILYITLKPFMDIVDGAEHGGVFFPLPYLCFLADVFVGSAVDVGDHHLVVALVRRS